jgi:hypothetical protein
LVSFANDDVTFRHAEANPTDLKPDPSRPSLASKVFTSVFCTTPDASFADEEQRERPLLYLAPNNAQLYLREPLTTSIKRKYVFIYS